MSPQGTGPATARQHKPDPKPFTPFYRGDFSPGSMDVPVYLPTDRQRYKLFRYGVRYFKRYKNRKAGEGKDMVLAWNYRHAKAWGLTLLRSDIEKQAERTHMILEKNRKDGSTVKGLRMFCRAAGVKSGKARRAKNADRDAAILRYVQDGGTISGAAREFGIGRQCIRNVLQRDRFQVATNQITALAMNLVTGPNPVQGRQDEEKEEDYAGACGVALNDIESVPAVERTAFAGGQMIFAFDLNFSRCGQ